MITYTNSGAKPNKSMVTLRFVFCFSLGLDKPDCEGKPSLDNRCLGHVMDKWAESLLTGD